jgi:hypothetical protein
MQPKVDEKPMPVKGFFAEKPPIRAVTSCGSIRTSMEVSANTFFSAVGFIPF